MLFRGALVALVIAGTSGCQARDPLPVPEGRLRSTEGYSIQPPTGDDWTQEGASTETMWFKNTDVARVSFLTGAAEQPLASPLTDDDALLAFARKLTAMAGDDRSGRYSGLKTQYAIAADQPSCVDYRIESLDHGARNIGGHDALTMITRGRFCVHPDDRKAGVDLFYSIRHAPGVDIEAMTAEGEAFLRSLVFEPRA
jgi:hypothetical protein